MKDKVKAYLVKGGNNESRVAQMMDRHYAYAIKTYPEANVRFIADVVSTLD